MISGERLPSDEEEEGAQSNVALEEDSGLKNYFKEIVKNANRFGDKLDMTHYSKFLEHYNKKEASTSISLLESETR